MPDRHCSSRRRPRTSVALGLAAALILWSWGGPVRAQDAEPAPTPPSNAAPGDNAPDGEPGATDPAAERATRNLALLDEVLQNVRRRFYDRPNYHGVDIGAVRARHAQAVADADHHSRVLDALNTMLGDFQASHLNVSDARVGELYADDAPQLGFQLIKVKGAYFVDMIYEDGPAVAAGLKRGDRVVEIAGVPIDECALERLRVNASDPGIAVPYRYVILFDPSEPLPLTIQRQRDGALVALSVTPLPVSTLGATKASTRVVEHGAHRIGVFHAWNFRSAAVANAFYDAIRTFSDENVDGLVLDVRGRGGAINVIDMMLQPLRPDPDDGRTGHAFTRRGFGRAPDAPRWTKPYVVLIDEHSRSAKDVFAHVIRRDSLAPLVGRPTSGAVIATRSITLSNGDRLMLPVMDVRSMLIDRVKLEGHPVPAHFPVKPALPFAQGVDEIHEAGLDVLSGRIDAAAASAND